jgi:hypothetical protein
MAADAIVEDKTTIVPSTATQLDRKGAIAEALKSIDEEGKVINKAEDKVEDKKEDKTNKEEDKTKEEEELLKQQGYELLKALKNPEQAGNIIKFLAEQAGYVRPPETKQEAKEIKNDIIDTLKEHLGDELSFMADKLGPALEKILQKQVDKANADIRQEFQERKDSELKDQTTRAFSKITEDFFGSGEKVPDNLLVEMNKISDMVQPSADMSLQDYVKFCFNNAVMNLGIEKPNKHRQDKINRNKNDAPSKLASDRVPTEDNLSKPSKPLTRQEAVRLAIEQVNKDLEK